MKINPIDRYSKAAGKRWLSANLSPPNAINVKEPSDDASMSGIIPGGLHLCRARVRFIPVEQM